MKPLILLLSFVFSMPVFASWEIHLDSTYEKKVTRLPDDGRGSLSIIKASQPMPHRDYEMLLIVDREALDGRRIVTQLVQEVVSDLSFEKNGPLLKVQLDYEVQGMPVSQFRCFQEDSSPTFIPLKSCP